jgi:Phage integrase family
MVSTLLNEQGWNRDAIERQLAHGERDEVRAAYNYAQHLPERRKMMQSCAGAHEIQFQKGILGTVLSVSGTPGCRSIPVTRIERRHHLYEQRIGRAITPAVAQAQIAKKVTVYTLRHSFRDAPVRLQRRHPTRAGVLGHSDVSTTIIYTHVLPLGGRHSKSA